MAPVPPAAPKMCTVDRYTIEGLAQALRPFANGYAADAIAAFLTSDVNSSQDKKLAKEHKGKFTPETSIAAFEAYLHLQKLIKAGTLGTASLDAAVGRGDLNLFFNGSLSAIPNAHAVRIMRWHDGDTPTIVEGESAECSSGTATMSVRVSGIDTPEVGGYNERLADGARGAKNPYLAAFSMAPAKNENIEYDYTPPPPDDDAFGLTAASSGWINGKMVENVDKIHLELAKGKWDPQRLSYGDREAFNNIVAATIAHTGEIATVPVQDLLSWNIDPTKAGVMWMVESQIRWTSDDTPKQLCGTWQPYDVYGRRLGSFDDPDAGRMSAYLHNRFAKAMAEAGPALMQKYRAKVDGYLKRLEGSKEKELYSAAKAIVDGAPDAAALYEPTRVQAMADAFDRWAKEQGSDAASDQQAMQVIIGTAYDYMKYRNQFGDRLQEAGKVARQARFGLWTETTFRTLWLVNSRNSRYTPTDCAR